MANCEKKRRRSPSPVEGKPPSKRSVKEWNKYVQQKILEIEERGARLLQEVVLQRADLRGQIVEKDLQIAEKDLQIAEKDRQLRIMMETHQESLRTIGNAQPQPLNGKSGNSDGFFFNPADPRGIT